MGNLRKILRDRRPSPAMVVASVALLVALGGTSVAAVNQLAANSVGTSQLKSNAVTTPKIKNSAVNASKLASNAVATAKIAGNAVTNAKIANGTIQPADLSAAAKTSGPPGPPGAAGPTGPTGPAGAVTRLTAVVNASGSIARSQGTTSAGRLQEGAYEVVFNQSVTACTYVATLGNATTTVLIPPGSIGVASRSGNANGVLVETFDEFGGLADRPFHLAVIC